MLNIVDEFTHECLAIRTNRKLKAIDVIDVLSELFILRGVPGHIRSDNGPEFVAKAVQDRIAAVGAKTAYIDLVALGRTATSRASMLDCVTSCSMARSSTRYEKLRSSWKTGAVTTTLSGRTPLATKGHRHRRSSHQHSPPGRLRYVDRLRRPRWRQRQR